ncbi:hypothetical protein D3C72_2177180 [compost metagenome]
MVTMSAMFSGVQPSWARMKAGVRLSLMTREKEKTTSSGRTGLPEAKVASRRVKVMVLAASSATHSEARPGARTVVSSAS